MCVDFDPPTKDDLGHVRWVRPIKTTPYLFYSETFPGGLAPFLANTLATEWLPGMFGLVPHWGDPAKLFRMTYNARSETVAQKPAYRSAWRHRQFALIPVQRFYEPNYESGKPVRWRIERADSEPFALAGIWERRMDDSGPGRKRRRGRCCSRLTRL